MQQVLVGSCAWALRKHHHCIYYLRKGKVFWEFAWHVAPVTDACGHRAQLSRSENDEQFCFLSPITSTLKRTCESLGAGRLHLDAVS